ncbi:MAG: hypothetical protein GXP39_16490 [Chloroflexi bacterium]|nr:hypothetical protein [Chloroflexota bacterium]
MASVLETLTGLALDPSVISALQSDMTGVAGRVPSVPTSDLQQITTLVGQIALPDQQSLFGDGAALLGNLVATGLRSPDELWSPITDSLDGLEQALAIGLQTPMTGAFDQIQGILTAIPDDPTALLGSLAGPLQQAASALSESPDLQRAIEFISKINDLRAQLDAAPAQLATLFRDQIQAAIDEALAPVSPVTRQLDGFLTSLDTRLQTPLLVSRYEAILLKLIPSSGPSLAEAIATLDFASEEAVATIDGQLSVARVLLEDLGREAEERLGEAATLVPLFNVEAWGQRLASAATLAASGQVNDLTDILSRWQDGLVQAQTLVADLSLDHALQPLRDLVTQLQSLLDGFNLDQVKAALQTGIQTISNLVEIVRQAQVDIQAGLQILANNITQAIDAIDLSLVTGAVDNALSAIDPVITQIEGLIDTVSTQLQGALTSLQSELDTLHTNLTDPSGSFRQPIENFLNAIRDAIPDDIPETLEGVGQTIADAVSGLDEIAFDPVFDVVVAELENMRQELQQIDVGSLNELLRAALAAALAVFQAFDFQSEVEEFLIEKFDSAIEEVSEPIIQTLQEQVDGIMDFLRKNDPAMLFETTLGITDAYDEMVAQLDSFRPSQALKDVLAPIRQIADQMEAFTPSQVLQPILGPLEDLHQFVQGLSLDPVFAQLQQLLDRLASQLAELDIAKFIDQLDEVIGRVRQRLNDLLTVDGLLDFLRPIHTAVMDALNTLDPSVLLQPLTDIRQTLLNAIDAVDTSALTDAFNQIGSMIDGLKLPNLRSDLQTKVQTLTAGLTTLDLPGKLTQLRAAQQAIQAALEARGEQSDPEAERRRQMLLYTAQALDPLPILASAIERFRTLESALNALASSLDTLLSDGGPLRQPLTALSDRLREVALGITEGAADIKQALRDAITQAYQALGVDTIQAIFEQVKATFQSFSPENLEATLNELLAPVRNFLDNLPDPSAILNDVGTAFNDLKTLIDPGLRDLLNQVRISIQPILDAITAKIGALDPSAILGELDAKYTAIVALKDRLLNKLQAVIDGLDAPYQQVVQLIDDLNPGTVLVEPLSATYQAILDKIEGIDIRAVFQPLLDALKALRDELVAGIDRTVIAFESFLAAAPTGAIGATVSV